MSKILKISNNVEFVGAGRVWMFSEIEGKITLKNIRPFNGKDKEFIPPTLDEVKKYFQQEGYKEETAERAFRHYNSADWHNSKGKKVVAWKQTMSTNWMTPENKIVKEEKKDKMIR